MFETDISDITLSFEQWTNFESRLQQDLMDMELSESVQNVDFTTEIKQVYTSVTKATKAIERKWKQDVQISEFFKGTNYQPKLIIEALAQTHSHEGRFHIPKLFEEITSSNANYVHYQELYNLMKYLHEGQYELILDWCNKNVVSNKRDLFNDLLFDIHSQKFRSLLSHGRHKEALLYAKHNFGTFRKTKTNELKQLMVELAFAGTDFYQQYVNSGNKSHKKIKTERLLQEAFCKLYNLALSSPMSLCFEIGLKCLPKIFKVMSLLKENKGIEWNQQDELPIEIPLTGEMNFHSVFCCPVLKQQTRNENPPLLLPCGHALCHETINRLSKGNDSVRFKCPYCPSDTTTRQLIKIVF